MEEKKNDMLPFYSLFSALEDLGLREYADLVKTGEFTCFSAGAGDGRAFYGRAQRSPGRPIYVLQTYESYRKDLVVTSVRALVAEMTLLAVAGGFLWFYFSRRGKTVRL